MVTVCISVTVAGVAVGVAHPVAAITTVATVAAQSNRTPADGPRSNGGENDPMDDPYLWLENIDGDQSLDWVRERNRETTAAYATGPEFDALDTGIRTILDTDARIPTVSMRGRWFYNFWKDAAHPRGLWRRTTLDSYRTDSPQWDVLIDLDALAAAEQENWVWSGARVLRPQQDRVLVSLSRGGADATVIREFSIERRDFVSPAAGGFALAEAKSEVSWIDDDTLYVGTDLGPDSITESGYPRLAVRWRRGDDISNATIVLAGASTDVAVSAWQDRTAGFERGFIARSVDFFHTEVFLVGADDQLTRIEAPTDASVSVHREWLTIQLRTAWDVAGTIHPAGALLLIRFDDFLDGGRDFAVVFTPDPHSALHDYAWTRGHLLLVVLRDVVGHLLVATPDTGGVRVVEPAGVPTMTSVELAGTDPESDSELFLITAAGHVTAPSLLIGDAAEPEPRLQLLKDSPAFFDTAGIEVIQQFATSADGTAVPYFVVGRPDTQPGPTLLYGYGGFEVSLTPAYSGALGVGWLNRGGTYVVANIRGGGEYGPEWHTSVLRAGRHKVHEDFAAVAADLVRLGVTTVDQLGAQGGSNGGLLMGIMVTRYPELFGAVVCQVPLLDMRRFHLLLAGASWVAEYGNPDDPAEWEFIKEYSPYQNIAPYQTDSNASGRHYPALLLTTSTRDDRVHPGHARKMCAALTAAGHAVAYYENIEGGHGGAADNAQLAFRTALAYRFLQQKLIPVVD